MSGVGYFWSRTSNRFPFSRPLPRQLTITATNRIVTVTPTFEAMITPLFSFCKALWTLGWAQSHFASSLSSSAAPPVSSPLLRLGGCARPSLHLSLKCFNCSLEFLKFWFSTVSWLGVLLWGRYFARRYLSLFWWFLTDLGHCRWFAFQLVLQFLYPFFPQLRLRRWGNELVLHPQPGSLVLILPSWRPVSTVLQTSCWMWPA